MSSSSKARPLPPDGATVLIVGAGPVGLGLAIELGSRGIDCVVVEQNDRVGYNPRAKLTNVRSMELMRRWGIADRLRNASPMPKGYPSDVVFATHLNGPLLARFENAFYTKCDGCEWYSESAAWLPQYTLEQVLLERALELPSVSICFSTRLESFTDDGREVAAVVTDLATSARRTVRGRYLVGADGGRSRVRELLNIGMSGLGAISPNFNVLFRAPALASMHDKGLAVQYWMVNSTVPSLMGPMDEDGLWYLIATRIGKGVDPATIDAKELVRMATGLDFDMEIISRDPWVAHRLIADRYRVGNVLLAGDACHLHPPFGGFGMNMGLGDAVDLGWKLAGAIQGWGGEGLLDSYETERKPVHERVMDEAVTNYSLVGNQLVNENIERDDAVGETARAELGQTILSSKLREFRNLGLILGYQYKNSPLIAEEAGEAPAETVTEYYPSAYPGRLAPHFRLDDGSSVYDHFGPGYTLLTEQDGDSADCAALREAAQGAGVPLAIVHVSGTRFRELYGCGHALVRPDQHIAWRGQTLPSDAAALLDRVRGYSRQPA